MSTLNQLLLNLTVLGVQAATAFSQAQDRLGLQHVLDADRMTSPRGLAQSREAVQQLLALMAQYKAVHAQLITGATSQWVAAMEGMPEDSRAALQQHLTQAINQNLQDQARLYECREPEFDTKTPILRFWRSRLHMNQGLTNAFAEVL